MSDTTTDEPGAALDQNSGVDLVAPGGVTKGEVIQQAQSRNPASGSSSEPVEAAPPGTPQFVPSQQDRLIAAGDARPTTTLDDNDKLEEVVRDSRQEQFDAWKNPETLSEQSDNLQDFLHAGDFTPGGRFSDEAEEADYFQGGRSTLDPIAKAVEEEQAAREEGQRQSEEALNAQANADTPDTLATDADNQTPPTGMTGDQPPNELRSPSGDSVPTENK